jgi:hypothetical protein
LKLALALESAVVTARVSSEGSVPTTTVIGRFVRRPANWGLMATIRGSFHTFTSFV